MGKRRGAGPPLGNGSDSIRIKPGTVNVSRIKTYARDGEEIPGLEDEISRLLSFLSLK